MKTLLKILAKVKIDIISSLSYASAVWIDVVITMIQIIILFYVYEAIYKGKSSIDNIGQAQITTYIILSRILLAQISMVGINLLISRLIQRGEIGIELLRPMDFQVYIYSVRIGGFIGDMCIKSIPTLLISLILFHIQLPRNLYVMMFFLLSIIISMTISFLIEFILGLVSFYTYNGWAMHLMKAAVFSFFSGGLIPINFFPQWLKNLSNILPFKQLIYIPVAIYEGIISPEKILMTIGVQLSWVLILFILSRVFFNISIKKLTVQGG